MGKFTHDDVLDAALNEIKTNATRICVCSAQPTTSAEAITTYKLAIKTISSSDFTGPSNGDVSGRKLRSNAHAGVTIDSTGAATHIALVDTVNSKLLHVTTCTSQNVNGGELWNIPAFDIEFADPS